MAWKKDLEKLKQSLGAEDLAPPKPAPPPKPKPTEFKPIEEEDAVFLSAMGQRPQAKPAPLASPRPAPAPAPAPKPSAEFASAMGDLKGLVALRPPVAAPVPPPAAAAPEPPPAPEPVPEPPAPAAAAPEAARPAEEAAPLRAEQINLAAGMAVDVDASLDLKGHGRADAEDRLKERILDGHVLGWRTLHVVLGPSEELRQMLLDLLGTSASARISRFAQAPIPMGGRQAWILYFRSPTPPAEPS